MSSEVRRKDDMHLLTLYGLAGLVGAVVFTLSLAALHVARPEIDWTQDYVSHFVHGRLDWLFVSGIVAHGLGNLALSRGLRRSLGPGRLRTWAVVLFGTAAAGIVLAAVFPIDPTGSFPTLVGRAHRSVIYIAFLAELVALFLFSAAFARDPVWRWRRGASFVLSTIAAVALGGFLIAVLLNQMLGLAERLALASFMAWEFWVAFQLVRRLPVR